MEKYSPPIQTFLRIQMSWNADVSKQAIAIWWMKESFDAQVLVREY